MEEENARREGVVEMDPAVHVIAVDSDEEEGPVYPYAQSAVDKEAAGKRGGEQAQAKVSAAARALGFTAVLILCF